LRQEGGRPSPPATSLHQLAPVLVLCQHRSADGFLLCGAQTAIACGPRISAANTPEDLPGRRHSAPKALRSGVDHGRERDYTRGWCRHQVHDLRFPDQIVGLIARTPAPSAAELVAQRSQMTPGDGSKGHNWSKHNTCARIAAHRARTIVAHSIQTKNWIGTGAY